MLPTLGAPSKKSTPEQQMAMMRTYLNQLKDDTEGELYNIRWENLAKPLQDKLNGLDKDIVAQGEQFDYLNANMVSVGYLEANYLTASQIASNYIATNQLDAQLVNSYYLNSQYVYAGTINVDQLSGGYIDASHIDAATIRAGLVVANDLYTTGNVVARGHLSATEISSKFNSAETTVFNRINLGSIPKSNTTSSLRVNVGQTYANVYLKATSTQGQYYLVVNMPD